MPTDESSKDTRINKPMTEHQASPTTRPGTRDNHEPVLGLTDLVNQFYDDVRGIAHARLRRLPPSGTMHTADLLQEALFRLARHKREGWHSKVHFFADVTQAVRQAVADYVRRKKADKRDAKLVCDDAAMESASVDEDKREATPAQKLAIYQALERLQERDRRAAKIVFYRFFCGLSMPQIAQVLRVSTRCVERDWAKARAWLEDELSGQ